MPLSRRVFLGAAALPGALLGAATARAATAMLVCPVADAPPVLIPGISDSVATRLIGSNLYRGLTRLDAEGVAQPDLATWAVSADGLRLTFRLQPRLTWHDASPITAADIVFSLTQFHDALMARRLPGVVAVEARDPGAVVITLDQPRRGLPAALHVLAAPIIPRHVHNEPGWGLDPRKTPPIGAGPFRLDGWLRLVRFDWFVGPRPVWDEVVLPILPDPAARIAALQDNPPGLLVADTLDPGALADLRDDPALVVEAANVPAAIRRAQMLLGPAPPLDNPELRLALAAAIDSNALLWNVWNGLGREADGPAYDPRAAAAHLQAAGLRPGDDGIRANLRLLLPSDPALQRLPGALGRLLSLVAITVQPETVPQWEFQRRVDTGQFELAAEITDQPADPAAIALAEPALIIARDHRLTLPAGIYGSFAEAALAISPSPAGVEGRGEDAKAAR